MSIEIVLNGHDSRLDACRAINAAEDGMVLILRPPRRNMPQNAKFHAICHDFAESGIVWGGKTRSPGEWKTLLISGHAVATGTPTAVIEGLEGELVNVRESSARMSRRRASSLIEYAQAMLAQLGGG